VSMSSPWSQANGAFVKKMSSLTVQGACAPSVAPKKQGDASFLLMSGGRGGAGGRCGAGTRTTESKASTQDAVYKVSEPPATLWLFFFSRKVTTCYDGRSPTGWMVSSSRMRLERRPKDDDSDKKMCPDGVKNGYLQIRGWGPIGPISGL